MKFSKETWDALIKTAKESQVFVEGNILRLFDCEDVPEWQNYVNEATAQDKEKRKIRLDISKKAQAEKVRLKEEVEKNTRLMAELETALEKAKASRDQAELARETADLHRREAEESRIAAMKAKASAETDLDFVQKQKQFRLVNQIVRASIYVICGVGLITSALYVFLILHGANESQVSMMGNTWSNMFGILLTNSFSIIGTIMGVKYANEKSEE